MDVVFAYRGRRVTKSDLGQIRALIAAHPEASRRALSKQLCEAWQWVQPNGQPRRKLDVSRARERFGFVAETPLVEGLRRTVAWYVETGSP